MSCHVRVRGMWNIGHKDMEHGMVNGEWGSEIRELGRGYCVWGIGYGEMRREDH